MSVLSETNERRKRFHAEIARRALLVPQRTKTLTYFIPNVPYGEVKIAPPVEPDHMPEWYHCMWFHDLVLKPYLPSARHPSIERIQASVAKFYGLAATDLLSARQFAKVVRPRHVAMYLCRTLTPRSFPEIGRLFGNRDHTTILHGVNKITRDMQSDERLASEIKTLTAMVQA
jgi:hypothetical protein